jgi:O-antigen/teichoic acid export membrane protein
LISNLKIFIIFPAAFLGLGLLGLLGSYIIPLILAAIFSLVIVGQFGIRLVRPNISLFKEVMSYSAANYMAGILMSAPQYILPILVLQMLGPENAAYYYIDYAVCTFLFVISLSFTTSLFVEGSHGGNLRHHVLNSLSSMFILLIPSILFLWLFGDFFLGIIGKNYSSSGIELLKIMSISSIFYAIYQIFITQSRIQKNIKILLFQSGMSFILLLGLSYLFLDNFGLIGIGYAWVICYGLCSLLFFIRDYKTNKLFFAFFQDK